MIDTSYINHIHLITLKFFCAQQQGLHYHYPLGEILEEAWTLAGDI